MDDIEEWLAVVSCFAGVPVVFIFLSHLFVLLGRKRNRIRIDLGFQTAIYGADTIYATGLIVRGIEYLQAIVGGKSLGSEEMIQERALLVEWEASISKQNSQKTLHACHNSVAEALIILGHQSSGLILLFAVIDRAVANVYKKFHIDNNNMYTTVWTVSCGVVSSVGFGIDHCLRDYTYGYATVRCIITSVISTPFLIYLIVLRMSCVVTAIILQTRNFLIHRKQIISIRGFIKFNTIYEKWTSDSNKVMMVFCCTSTIFMLIPDFLTLLTAIETINIATNLTTYLEFCHMFRVYINIYASFKYHNIKEFLLEVARKPCGWRAKQNTTTVFRSTSSHGELRRNSTSGNTARRENRNRSSIRPVRTFQVY